MVTADALESPLLFRGVSQSAVKQHHSIEVLSLELCSAEVKLPPVPSRTDAIAGLQPRVCFEKDTITPKPFS